MIAGLLDGTLTENVARYREAIDQGLLKIMAKMGISVISSYRGGLNFEAVGLSRAMVAEYFPGMTSRISGIGVTGIQIQARRDPQPEGWAAAGRVADRRVSTRRANRVRPTRGKRPRCICCKWPVTEPRPMSCGSSIRPRCSPPADPSARSDGLSSRWVTDPAGRGGKHHLDPQTFRDAGHVAGRALSPEAHKTLNVAMNRIGAKSDSGEGGEDPAHFVPEPNGDNPSAKIKQVASGRFGVTAEYLNQCEELGDQGRPGCKAR